MKYQKLFITSFTMILSIFFSLTCFAGEWKQDSAGWWYEYGIDDIRSTVYGTGEWELNYPISKWQVIENKIYYFDEMGYTAHDTVIDNFQVGSDGARINSYDDLNFVPYIDKLEEVIQENYELYYFGESFGLDEIEERDWQPIQLTDCGDYFEINDVVLQQTWVLGSELPPKVLGEFPKLRIRKDALCIFGAHEEVRPDEYIFIEKVYSVSEWIENFGLPRVDVRFDDKGYIVSFSDAAVS